MYQSGQCWGQPDCLATHLRTEQKTRQKDCLLNKSKARRSKQENNTLTQGSEEIISCCHVGKVLARSEVPVAASLVLGCDNTAALGASSNQPQLTPAALTRARLLLLKRFQPPASTFPLSTTTISLHPLRLLSSRRTFYYYTHTSHTTIQHADLRQDL